MGSAFGLVYACWVLWGYQALSWGLSIKPELNAVQSLDSGTPVLNRTVIHNGLQHQLLLFNDFIGQARWDTPVTWVPTSLRQNYENKASLDYRETPCLKKFCLFLLPLLKKFWNGKHSTFCLWTNCYERPDEKEWCESQPKLTRLEDTELNLEDDSEFSRDYRAGSVSGGCSSQWQASSTQRCSFSRVGTVNAWQDHCSQLLPSPWQQLLIRHAVLSCSNWMGLTILNTAHHSTPNGYL